MEDEVIRFQEILLRQAFSYKAVQVIKEKKNPILKISEIKAIYENGANDDNDYRPQPA